MSFLYMNRKLWGSTLTLALSRPEGEGIWKNLYSKNGHEVNVSPSGRSICREVTITVARSHSLTNSGSSPE